MSDQARHMRVEGHVQGVAFRFATRLEARSLDLQGWVRNLPDGSVGIYAEGVADQLDALEAWCRAGGPPSARVDRVLSSPIPARRCFTGFRIET